MRGTLSQIKVLTKIKPQGEFTEGGAAPLEFSVNANCRPSPELDAKSKKVGRFVRQPTHVIWPELSAHGGDALLGISPRPRSLAAQATEAPSPPDLHLVVSGEQCAHPEIQAHQWCFNGSVLFTCLKIAVA